MSRIDQVGLGLEAAGEARYREITPRHRLVQTFEWDGMPGHVAINEATFEDLGDGRTLRNDYSATTGHEPS